MKIMSADYSVVTQAPDLELENGGWVCGFPGNNEAGRATIIIFF